MHEHAASVILKSIVTTVTTETTIQTRVGGKGLLWKLGLKGMIVALSMRE